MSEIKVNKISPRSGTTVTLGDSGDTFTIPAGATINNQGTATNFGATGSASWTTTVKTGDFTAVAGEGYFVDTSSGEIDVTLPAGTAGAVVAIADYAKNFATHNVVLVQNGSDKIGGSTNNGKLSTNGLAVTLIFIDSTKGWIVTDDGDATSVDTNPFIVATGGTVTCSGNDRIHTFTGPGTFCVSKIATCSANNVVSYLVVGGGGSGANAQPDRYTSGGGGAGGVREVKSPSTPSYTASPLDGYPNSPNRITVTQTGFPVTVGAGGAAPPGGGPATGGNGSNTSISTITSAGGGKGETNGSGGSDGGSGGGGSGPGSGGSGNTPSTSPSQGNNGGSGCGQWNSGRNAGGGGGGAGGAGGNGSGPGQVGGPGGTGVETNIPGSPLKVGGGGQGSTNTTISPTAPYSDFGGGHWPSPNRNGEDNTGGGGSGGTYGGGQDGGAGGSGVVIIRYKFQ